MFVEFCFERVVRRVCGVSNQIVFVSGYLATA